MTSLRAPVRHAHLGLGAFHRAHQAWYSQRANDSSGDPWGITAFTGRSPGAARRLAALDHRYDLLLRDSAGDARETIESIVDSADGGDAVRWREVAERVAVFTLTITESAYALDDRALDDEALRMRAGLFPATALGRFVDGMRARAAAGGGPLAVVSCDNLPGNGELLRRRVYGIAERTGTDLRSWIGENVSFVSSVVDRITPAATPSTPPGVLEAESAASWILTGEFPAGRPSWEVAGARFVADITPFERRKLWMLNGAHTLLATAGPLRGHASIADAMSDAAMRRMLESLWDDAAAVLPFTDDEMEAERRSLSARFANARIHHSLSQIARDTPTKLRIRVIPVIAERRRRGLDPGRGELAAVAAWTVGCDAQPAAARTPDAAAEEALRALAPELLQDAATHAELTDVIHRIRTEGES